MLEQPSLSPKLKEHRKAFFSKNTLFNSTYYCIFIGIYLLISRLHSTSTRNNSSLDNCWKIGQVANKNCLTFDPFSRLDFFSKILTVITHKIEIYS